MVPMQPESTPPTAPAATAAGAPVETAASTPRAALGGLLMGLANLVPGVSGGTMLLAVGVYEAFVSAVAELSTLRFRLRSLVLLATIAGSAALAILLLAGPTKELVVSQRWVMYSLFIGLTLGGVPIVWRMAQPLSRAVAGGATLGLAVMVATFLVEAGGGSGESDPLTLVVAGLAGASAMVLPGISGGYLLLLMGQYVPILSGIDDLKRALTADGGVDPALLRQALAVVVPVGIGVGLGIVAVSNLVRWLLVSARQATLGVLLGLLLGAVLGLWPFQHGARPEPGQVHDGRVLDATEIAALDPEDWPLARFDPSPVQVAGAVAFVGLGLLATRLIDRLGARGGGARSGA